MVECSEVEAYNSTEFAGLEDFIEGGGSDRRDPVAL